MQNTVRREAYKLLQSMTFSKNINESVKRSIRVRLVRILEQEEQNYKRWKEFVAHKLNKTRNKQVDREFNKRIQALKIVIHNLTPFFDRVDDVPMFVVRKEKKT